jgi:hypothetical protein
VKERESPLDPDLLTAGAVGFAVGALLGWAASGRPRRRNQEVGEFLDELIAAAREGLLSSVKGGPALDQAMRRLRALGERVRSE